MKLRIFNFIVLSLSISTALGMENPSEEPEPSWAKESFQFEPMITGDLRRFASDLYVAKIRQNQCALREMLNDKPTYADLAQKCSLDQLGQAEKDAEDISNYENMVVKNATSFMNLLLEEDNRCEKVICHEARARLGDALQQEKEAREQLATIKVAIAKKSDSDEQSSCCIQ